MGGVYGLNALMVEDIHSKLVCVLKPGAVDTE